MHGGKRASDDRFVMICNYKLKRINKAIYKLEQKLEDKKEWSISKEKGTSVRNNNNCNQNQIFIPNIYVKQYFHDFRKGALASCIVKIYLKRKGKKNLMKCNC